MSTPREMWARSFIRVNGQVYTRAAMLRFPWGGGAWLQPGNVPITDEELARQYEERLQEWDRSAASRAARIATSDPSTSSKRD